jgi:hypothetical protein
MPLLLCWSLLIFQGASASFDVQKPRVYAEFRKESDGVYRVKKFVLVFMFFIICAPAFGDIITPPTPWELIKDRPQTSRPAVDIPDDAAVSDDAASNDVISGDAVSADVISGDVTSGDAASDDLPPEA